MKTNTHFFKRHQKSNPTLRKLSYYREILSSVHDRGKNNQTKPWSFSYAGKQLLPALSEMSLPVKGKPHPLIKLQKGPCSTLLLTDVLSCWIIFDSGSYSAKTIWRTFYLFGLFSLKAEQYQKTLKMKFKAELQRKR